MGGKVGDLGVSIDQQTVAGRDEGNHGTVFNTEEKRGDQAFQKRGREDDRFHDPSADASRGEGALGEESERPLLAGLFLLPGEHVALSREDPVHVDPQGGEV